MSSTRSPGHGAAQACCTVAMVDAPKGAVLSTLIHGEDVNLEPEAASGSVVIPVQGATSGESFAVGVVNNLAEGIVLTFVSVETDESDVAHDLAVKEVSIAAGAEVVRLVEGWLLSPASKIDIAVDGGSTAAGGIVSFWVRQNS